MEEKWYRATDKELGNKQFLVQDPDGYLLRFFQDLELRTLKIQINDHVSSNLPVNLIDSEKKPTHRLKITQLYFHFLSLEIVNCIQIFSLLSIFASMLSDRIQRISIIWITCSLFGFYLISKSFEFLQEQLVVPYSEMNIYRLDLKIVKIFWTFFIALTAITFATLVVYSASLIS